MENNFLSQFLSEISFKAGPDEALIQQLVRIKDILTRVRSIGKKVIIIGNGASASIASHVSIDLTKTAGIRCINFNEANLLTCFGNDFGYIKWVEKALHYYGDEKDVLIAVSSSGQSENILLGCQKARDLKFEAVITLSGFLPDNPLRSLGDINLWIDSNNYNIVENIHQIWLLAIVELLISERKGSIHFEE